MKNPNIIFIMNDHQLYYRHGWDVGMKPKRPYYDNLAKDGILFNKAYCPTPLCGPTRRSLLNGQYPHTHQHYFNYSNIPYDEESYLRILDQNGYKNYYFGKWHAGEGTAITHHNCEGFSVTDYGNPYITEAYKYYCQERGIEPAKHLVERDYTPYGAKLMGKYHNLKEGELYECISEDISESATGITTTSKESHEAFFLANLACDAIKKHVTESSQPFHLRLDFWGPHHPYFPTQEYIDMYDSIEIPIYGSFYDSLEDKADVHKRCAQTKIATDSQYLIQPSTLHWEEWQHIIARAFAQQTMIDDAAGRVLNLIKELGIDDNTLIIYTADHGDSLASHGGHFDKYSYLTEEVIRIPMAMKWPEKIKPNQVSDHLVSNLDVPITILDAAGLCFTQQVHGESLLKITTGNDKNWRQSIVSETRGHGYLERLFGRAIIKGDYKLSWYEGQIKELYNLKEDPYELKNLVYYDKYTNIVLELIEELKEWQKQTNDPASVD